MVKLWFFTQLNIWILILSDLFKSALKLTLRYRINKNEIVTLVCGKRILQCLQKNLDKRKSEILILYVSLSLQCRIQPIPYELTTGVCKYVRLLVIHVSARHIVNTCWLCLLQYSSQDSKGTPLNHLTKKISELLSINNNKILELPGKEYQGRFLSIE